MASAIELRTEIPGPRSRALAAERRLWVSRGVGESRLGLFFESGEGARLTDVDGNVFLDLAGGIGALNAGHSPPRVVGRALEQLTRLQHTCFQTAGYESYVALARNLATKGPIPGPAKVALFNSGAEAVENAVKIARRATGRARRARHSSPAFTGARSWRCPSPARPIPIARASDRSRPRSIATRCPTSSGGRGACRPRNASSEAIFHLHKFLRSTVAPESLACVVIEPVLGEGGFLVPPRAFLDELMQICRECGILLVADEVQTGFSRTGALFGCQAVGLTPDVVCLGKSLSNGLPLSAVVGRADVMDAVPPGGLGGTFGGNPVACAAALGALETHVEEDLAARARALGDRVEARFRSWTERFEFVGDARGIGAMRAIELVRDRATLEPDRARTERLIDRAAERGVLALPAGLHGNVIRTLMPLVMTDAELDEALSVLERCLEDEAASS